VIRGILSKEFYQHRLLLQLLPFLIICGWALYAGMRELALAGGSQFYNLSWFFWLFFPLFALILANAIVADEFRQRTQVFLEGLPVPRFVFLSVKYAVGMFATCFTAALLLGVTSVLNWSSEGISSRFAFLLVIKTLLWAWFCWSALFAFAFLGRYRFATGFVLILTLLFLENQLEIKVSRFGPFSLIGEQFAYERDVIPTAAITTTLAFIFVLTAIGFAFGMFRDATMANILAEKMSFREKLVITAMIFCMFFIIGSVVDRQKSTEPLEMPGAIDLTYARGTVSVAAAVAKLNDEENDALERHAQAVSKMLDEMGEYLDIPRLPKLFLVHRGDLDPDRFELGDLDTRQGVLIRLNALENGTDNEKWLRMVIRSVLMAHQHGRLDSDTRDWVVTGFSVWWPARNDASFIEQQVASDVSSSEVVNRDLRESDLVRWRAYKKEVGESRAQLVAGKILVSLSEKITPESMRAFLRTVLAYRAPYDFRATIHDYWYSVPSTLRTTAQLNLSDLIPPMPQTRKETGP
jgi:hypothetical protein